MPQDDGHSIIVVGDLHLARGHDPVTGKADPNDHFLHDDAFARFLDDVRGRAAKKNQRPRLLILGDFFDFLHVGSDPAAPTAGHPETSDRATLAKLEQIAAGHPAVFAALARFVSAGLPLDIVPGNHDIELVRPSTQEGFTNLLMRFGCLPESKNLISFHPWIYFVPGLLYAEHGHQYHDINAFVTLLEPFQHHGTNNIQLPPGSFLDLYLLNLLAVRDPPVPSSGSSTRGLVRALRAHSILVLRTLPLHARYLRLIFRSLMSQTGTGEAKRQSYRKNVLRPFADQLGLSHETLVAIDELSAHAIAKMWSRLLRKLVFAPLPFLRARLGGSPARLTQKTPGYLHDPAAAIHRILEAKGQAVPFYAFGHTHHAEQRPLGTPNTVPYYINGGSWIVKTPITIDATLQRPPFTFIEIERPLGKDEPVAQVMLWDDAAGHATPVAISERSKVAAVLSSSV